MEKISDRSRISKSHLAVIIACISVIIAMMSFSIYRYLDIGFWSPLEFFGESMIMLVLIERAQGRLFYELDKKMLRIKKRGLFGTQEYTVSLKDVIGIYRYAPKLISPVKFRRTYRLHSALDPRTVWTVAYRAQQGGKTENRRMYLKVSDEFLAALNDCLPGKARIPEEQVVRSIILNEK